MDADIYYFSGTGNSLALARDIAEKINGKLLSIPSLMGKERIETDADVVGIVFPVYYATNESGIPLIISRFVRKLDLNSKYVFAICTHQGAPGATIENLGKLVKSCGGELAAGFHVKQICPFSTYEKLMHSLFHRPLTMDGLRDREKQQKITNEVKEKLQFICEYVAAGKTGRFETRGRLFKAFLAPFLPIEKGIFNHRYRKLAQASHVPFDDIIQLADRSFQTNPNCNGCGTCARVCPVNNIKLVNGNPVWQHHCENCLACFHWCPQDAIRGDIVEYAKQYHHPEVTLTDMLKQNSL